MATSTTELLLKFRGDSGDLKSTIAQVRAELAKLNTETQKARTSKAPTAPDPIPGLKSELSLKQQLAAVASLQRQRSAALTKEWNAQERALKRQEEAVRRAAAGGGEFTNVLRALGASIGSLQGPLNGISGRLSAFGTLARVAGGEAEAMSGAAASAGSSIAAIAGPVGIAIVVIAGMAAGAGLLAKGLFDLAVAAADFRGKMFDLSQQTGVAVETLSVLEVAARTTGGSIDGIAQSLVIFQGNLDEAQDSSSKAGKIFTELGISVTDTETSFRDALKAIAAMPVGFQQTNAAAELFGRRGGKQVLAILKELDGDLDGATEKLRALGLVISEEDAAAADQFNDQLAILQFQFRAMLGKEVIPAALTALKSFSTILTDNRRAINGFAEVIGTLSRVALAVFLDQLNKINDAMQLLERGAEFLDRARGSLPVAAVGLVAPNAKGVVGGVALAQSAASEQTESKELQRKLAALKELSGFQKAAADEAKSIAATGLADSERAFQRGEITRAQQLKALRLAIKEKRDIELDALQKERTLKLAEFDLAVKANTDQVGLINQLAEMDGKRREIGRQAEEEDRKARDKFQADERKNLAEHEQAKLQIFLEGSRNRLAAIADDLAAGRIDPTQAAIQQDSVEAEQIKREGDLLRKQLKDVGVDPGNRQKAQDQLDAFEVRKTEIVRQQSERRIQIAREAGESEVEILLANLDTIVKRREIEDQARIDAIKARGRNIEDAETDILLIRLAAIDREKAAIEARQSATFIIADPLARAKAEADLNNQLKILATQRTAIKDKGFADIEEGRQEDLELERKYARDLLQIQGKIADMQRSNAQVAINLMILNHARRRDVIKAQLALDIADEDARHREQEVSIAAQRKENEASNRTAEEKHAKTVEINILAEEEAERHRLAMQGIEDQAKQDKARESGGGGFLSGLETGQLTELKDGIQSFADVAVVAFSAVGAAVNGLAQGFGSMLQNWVLMGSQADLNMKKMVASVLAGVAAQSAVLAIFELAKGFASLFFNPAEAAAHFHAAALFGSIAVASALIGRAVAGNAFQNTSDGAADTRNPSDTGSQSRGSTTGSGEPKVTDYDRRNFNVPNATLTLVVPHGWLGNEMKKDYDLNGYTRMLIKEGA